MNAYEIARAEATRVVEAAYRKAVAAGELPEGTIPPVAVETPKDSSNGDWASTFAMQCAKPLHMAPRKIAESIVANLDLEGSCFDTVTIAGPGFMNFTLNQGWYEQAVRGVFTMGENYGRTESKKPEKVMVEFVSANPTGPMHMGNARGGVLGDCLSSVLDWSGNDVTREFYINDAGNQVDKFAHSVEGRYIQEIKGEDAIEFDASWYQGDDIKALAHDLVEQYGDSLLEKTPEERFAVIEGYGLPTNIARMERDLTGEFIDKPDFAQYNKIVVPEDEAYGANCIWVNGTVIVAEGYPTVLKAVQDLGYKTLVVDTSEYRKVDGGLSCLSLRF